MTTQTIIVPQISSMPGHEARARLIINWLAKRSIIEPQPSTCGLAGARMAYAIAEGARRVVDVPQGLEVEAVLPFSQAVNGLEVVTKRCIYTPQEGFAGEAGCPECRREVGEALFDSLEDWWPGHTDNFTCPLCGKEDDINGFLYPQPCGFSNLGFIFNNWDGAYFKPAFLEDFAERLGYPIAMVHVKL